MKSCQSNVSIDTSSIAASHVKHGTAIGLGAYIAFTSTQYPCMCIEIIGGSNILFSMQWCYDIGLNLFKI